MTDIQVVAVNNDDDDKYEDWVLDHVDRNSRFFQAVDRWQHHLTEKTYGEIKALAKVTRELQAVRFNLWQEIAAAKEEGRRVIEKNIWDGAVSRAFYNNLITEWHWKFAYVLTPIKSFKKQLELIEHIGLQAMQDIMEADVMFTKRGGHKKHVNIPLAKLQHDVFKTIMNRHRGKEVERKQVHHTKQDEKPLSIDDLNKQIEELKEVAIEVAPNR